MNRRIAILLMLVLVFASSAWADVMISVGDFQVAPGGTVQVPIYATGNETLDGMDFDFQITSTATGSQPTIQSVDLLTGTVWGTIANTVIQGAVLPENQAQLTIWGISPLAVTGPQSFVTLQGTQLLATVTISADASVANGTFSLSVMDTLNGPMDLVHTATAASGNQPYSIDLTGGVGTLHVTPEPISMSLLGFGAVGLLLRRRRR
jgi:hypothetical protein